MPENSTIMTIGKCTFDFDFETGELSISCAGEQMLLALVEADALADFLFEVMSTRGWPPISLPVKIQQAQERKQADAQPASPGSVALLPAEHLQTSPQMTLGKLIDALQAMDQEKFVTFTDRYHPTFLSSWRGSYAELALEYEEGPPRLTVAMVLAMLRDAVDESFYGYKGGLFVMKRTTPVWVANYGESGGFLDDTQAVTGVSQDEEHVILETLLLQY